MKKIVTFFVSALLLMNLTVCFASCAGDKITVTFVQSGQETIVKEVQKGGTLKDIPTPKAKTGYTVVWDTTSFSGLQAGLTVTAIETPNRYTITYELNNSDATIEANTKTVTYDAEVILYEPQSNSEKIVFKAWKEKESGQVFESGVYKVARDITLVAQWVIQGGDEWSEKV